MARTTVTYYATLPDGSVFGSHPFVLPEGMRDLPIAYASRYGYYRARSQMVALRDGIADGSAQPVSQSIPQSVMFSYHKRVIGDGVTRGPHAPPAYGADGFMQAQRPPDAVLAATAPTSFSFMETLQALADRMGLTLRSAPPLPAPPSLVRLRPSDMRNAAPVTAAQIVAGTSAGTITNPRARGAADALNAVRVGSARRF